jgi:hypothetical protein
MARKKAVQGTVVGDGGQAGGGDSPDADAILDLGLSIIRRDLGRIEANAEKTKRQLGLEEAQTVAGYVRALGGIARARSGRGAGGLGKLSMNDLISEVAKIPEVRAALEAGE